MNIIKNILNKIKVFIDQVLTNFKNKYILIKKIYLPNKKVDTIKDLNHRIMVEYFHINNFHNSDFPFTYLFDFINSIASNKDYHFINLTIRIQTCPFKTLIGKKHHNILFESMEEIKYVVIINNIKVNLNDDKLNLSLISKLSKFIIDCFYVNSLDKELDSSIDIVFEYEYILMDED